MNRSLVMSIEGRDESTNLKRNNSNKIGHYKPNIMQQKYCKQQHKNIDYINSITRHLNTSYQNALLLEKVQYVLYIMRLNRVCDQHRFNICQEIGEKLDNELWHEHVPKQLEKVVNVM